MIMIMIVIIFKYTHSPNSAASDSVLLTRGMYILHEQRGHAKTRSTRDRCHKYHTKLAKKPSVSQQTLCNLLNMYVPGTCFIQFSLILQNKRQYSRHQRTPTKMYDWLRKPMNRSADSGCVSYSRKRGRSTQHFLQQYNAYGSCRKSHLSGRKYNHRFDLILV